MSQLHPRTTTLRRRLLVAASAATVAAVAIAAAMIAQPAPATAALITVSPADRIDTPNMCTIAYTYTGADDHTYALTAGHCGTSEGRSVRDRNTGASGTFVTAVIDPPHSGGADYGLVDFGPRAFALPFIGNRPIAGADHPRPHQGQTVCRTGITTGQQCGTVAAAYGDHQYLTTGMSPSRGGDSGAPVWTMRDDGHVQVLGIWLGGRTTHDGHDYGRFAALSSAIATLDVATTA